MLLVSALALLLSIIIGVAFAFRRRRALLRQPHADRPLRVAVVGAGAAGMACAYSLSRCNNSYDVHVFDRAPQCGGVATSEDVAGVTVNDGVQGGALSTYANTLMLHEAYGFRASRVPLRVQFGTGANRWGNMEHNSAVLRSFQPEIRAFKRLMEIAFRFNVLFMVVKIDTLLWLLGYKRQFIDYVVLALTALFFGTGNQQGNVPAAVVARVFCDPEFAIFKLHDTLFVSGEADFFAFDKLRDIYAAMRREMESRGVKFSLNKNMQTLRDAGEFDCVVFACAADEALRILGPAANVAERFVLRNVRYFDDLTVTHRDADYMCDKFDMRSGGGDGDGETDGDGTMYFIRSYGEAHNKSSLFEMGFALSNYQPHARGNKIFQTIFLNRAEHEALWTRSEIDKNTIVLEKWWHQFAHTVQHFFFVVPFVRFLQSPARLFCGSWTMVNTHEAATISGFAVAHRLGAPYPFAPSGFAYRQFVQYLSLIHGV